MIKMNYSPEEVACNFCEYGTSNGNCKISICPFIAERIEAGVVGYREVVADTFPGHSKLTPRLNSLIRGFPGSLWTENQHQVRMEHIQLLRPFKRERDTPSYYAALYLLSSDQDLFDRAFECFQTGGIDFGRMQLQGISPRGYTLYSAARSIYAGDAHLAIEDMADPEIVDPYTFRLIINAFLIARYGLPVLEVKDQKARFSSTTP